MIPFSSYPICLFGLCSPSSHCLHYIFHGAQGWGAAAVWSRPSTAGLFSGYSQHMLTDKYYSCTGLNRSDTLISICSSETPVLAPFAHHIPFWLVVFWTCGIVFILGTPVTSLLGWIPCLPDPFFVDYSLTLAEHIYPDIGGTGGKFCDYACL